MAGGVFVEKDGIAEFVVADKRVTLEVEVCCRLEAVESP